MRARLALAGVLASAGLGCEPAPAAPVKVMAVVPSARGGHEPRAVELRTITSITALKGTVAELLGGNRVVVDSADPLQQQNGGLVGMTDAQRYEVVVKDKGLDVRGNYIARAGVLWPADFHTWNMVTTYYNFERSAEYYRGLLGADPPELRTMRVMYWPDVRILTADAITDNALYLSVIKSLVVVPTQREQKLPLAMNLGVIGHEVGHRVFNKRVLRDEGIHPAYGAWQLIPFNLLKSADEGLADYHGWGVTCLDESGCRPNFLAASIADATVAAMRDVARQGACLDEGLRTAFRTLTPGQWVSSAEMYRFGNLIASALYLAGQRVGQHVALQKSVLAAYDDESGTTPGLAQLVNQSLDEPGRFTPEAFANAVVSHIGTPTQPNEPLRRAVCNEFTTRLQLACATFPCAEMPACPSSAARTNDCPLLPPP